MIAATIIITRDAHAHVFAAVGGLIVCPPRPSEPGRTRAASSIRRGRARDEENQNTWRGGAARGG
eukprot:scaffold1883_cov396-Prasinococcus_capsulatus_cf.AAC.21